jgi:hypothetical protein
VKPESEQFAERRLSKGVAVHQCVAASEANQLFPMASAQRRVGQIVEQLPANLERTRVDRRTRASNYFDAFEFCFGVREHVPRSRDLRQELQTVGMLIARGHQLCTAQLLPLFLFDAIDVLTNVARREAVRGSPTSPSTYRTVVHVDVKCLSVSRH